MKYTTVGEQLKQKAVIHAECTDQQINIVNRKIYQAMAGYHACIQHLN